MRPKQKEIFWTSELAYVVGLITTDGCLSPDGRHFDFTSNDLDLIKTFKRCLNLSNKIAKKRSGYTNKLTSFRIQFGNITLYKWLVEIGLMPNKSKRLGSLDVPDKFFFDFLRGHLDGDGSIRKYFDPVYQKSLRLYTTFMSASLPHLLWIRKRVTNLMGIKGFLQEVRGAHKLTFSKGDSIMLLRRLYYQSSVPCLERKFKIAEEFLVMPR